MFDKIVFENMKLLFPKDHFHLNMMSSMEVNLVFWRDFDTNLYKYKSQNIKMANFLNVFINGCPCVLAKEAWQGFHLHWKIAKINKNMFFKLKVSWLLKKNRSTTS